jgi:CheY-like chemotaxis protein
MVEKTGKSVSILEASDGVEAYSILENESAEIDLVITSLMLSKMSGITLLKKMQLNSGLSKIPVIITCIGGGREIIEKQLSGCSLAGFLDKPVTYSNFLPAAGGYL